jgi:hypothetical protein
MMVDKYPNLKEEVGGSRFPAVKPPLNLTENLSGGQLPPMLRRWHVGLLSQKNKNKNKNKNKSMGLAPSTLPLP